VSQKGVIGKNYWRRPLSIDRKLRSAVFWKRFGYGEKFGKWKENLSWFRDSGFCLAVKSDVEI